MTKSQMGTNQLIHPRFPSFKGIILDMDGLAINSEPGFIVAWKKAAQTFGITLDDEMVRTLLGHRSEQIESALKNAIGTNFDGGQFRLLASQFWQDHVEKHGILPMPGLSNLIELLETKGIPFALATNSNRTNTEVCLVRSGLDKRFPIVVTRDHVKSPKPDPDLFLQAACRMGITAKDCLVLEDSDIGLQAAIRAEATAVLVNTNPTKDSKQLAAFAFHSLHEVADTIKHSFT